MPDWLTHSLVAWITGKTLRFEVSLVVLGSLLPDLNKLYLVFNWLFGLRTDAFFLPLHTPVGALLLACGVALFFNNMKHAFVALGIGIGTHFVLDVLLTEVGGGEPLLFPLSWQGWQFNVIPASDYEYMISVYAVLASVLVSVLFSLYKRKMVSRS
jgi:hypothetical protein